MTQSHPLTQSMNPEQTAAITAGDGPVLVLAGPGSGKTSVLTRRIAYLISDMQVPHHRIMAVTFTNKAAGEMRERVENLLDDRLRGLQIGTFHATCARFLRMEAESAGYKKDYAIYDSDDQQSLIKQVMATLNLDTKKFNPRAILGQISKAKNEMMLPHEYPAMDYFSEVTKRIYEEYQKSLKNANAMDFDDLLLNMVLLMKSNQVVREKYQNRFHYVLVDEFQDTNTVQYQLVKLFSEPQNNVFVVGDEDQAIYAFRGADYRNVLRFRQSYPDMEVILLEQNYRSTQNVLDVARAVIDNNHNRTPKALHTDKGAGDNVMVYEAYDERYEAEYIIENIHNMQIDGGYDYKDFAVMYRTNAQSRAIEQAFINHSIPYTLVGGVGFYKRREVRDMLSYLRVIQNPDDRVSFQRIINVPKRGIGKKSVQSFHDWVIQEDITYTEALDKLLNGEASSLSSSAKKKITGFAEKIKVWQDIAETGNLLNLFDTVTSQIGYHLYLDDISKMPEEAIDRSDNVRELRGLLQQSTDIEQPLHEFLAEQSLVSDVDSLKDDTDAVTLLTLHAAKGLEYPNVFITGLETGVLPHFRSFEEPEGIEEERRLFYVGVTRAKERLFLSYAFTRALYGGYGEKTSPSEFLGDIPIDLLDGSPTTLLGLRKAQSYESQIQWKPAPSGKESRLSRDMKTNTVSKSEPKPNSKLRSKIVQFPGTQEPENDPSPFKFGVRVYHPKFGEGKVIGVMHDMVDVMFDGQSLPKKIFADAEGFKVVQ
jgi:DNA helicase II / ATP-dependent DNA helicase PcrA